jgi:hypothetical protein
MKTKKPLLPASPPIYREENRKIIRIRSVTNLRKAVREGHTDFFILLNFGLRSSKNITQMHKRYSVLSEIDGRMGSYTAKQLVNARKTNIGEAMRHGAFFCRLSGQ